MIEVQIKELECLLRISDHTITVKVYRKSLDGKKELKNIIPTVCVLPAENFYQLG